MTGHGNLFKYYKRPFSLHVVSHFRVAQTINSTGPEKATAAAYHCFSVVVKPYRGSGGGGCVGGNNNALSLSLSLESDSMLSYTIITVVVYKDKSMHINNTHGYTFSL